MSSVSTQSTVVAYFSTDSAAEKAVDQLIDANFSSSQVGIALRSTTSSPVGSSPAKATGRGESAWEKVKNFFTSDPVEPYADERKQGAMASHEITADNEDYSREDFDDSLTGFSLPEEKSKYFTHRFGHGDQGAVVTVVAPGREAEANDILTTAGGDLGSDTSAYNYGEVDAAPILGQQRIQLLGEVLRVHKDRVQKGEVRVRKEVITETQTIEVPVTREVLVIERFAPSDGTTPGGRVGESSEIRIPLTEEVASVDKHTVVQEEVVVGKRAVEDVRSVGDTVSHEELVVEDAFKQST